MSDSPAPTWQQLLLQREQKSLRATFWLRAALACFGVVVVWFTAHELVERLASSALFLGVVVVCLVLLRQLAKPARLALVGTSGALLDSAALVGLVLIWHSIYTSPTNPLTHLLGHEITVITLVFVMVNGAALRPAYPAIVATAGALVHLVLAILAVTDPRLETYPGGLAEAIGPGRGVEDLFLTPILILVGGAILSGLTWAARRTVREVVEREEREHRAREQQLRLILEARMSALAQIVTGLEHEVNNPLGAVRSSTDTAAKALDRIRDALDVDDPDARRSLLDRALDALQSSVDLTSHAGERLGEVIEMIDGFVQPDRAQRGPVDLGRCVKSCVEMLPAGLRQRASIEIDVAADLVVLGDAGRLAQALTTVLKNAVESTETAAAVALRARRDRGWALLEVVDQGRGMTREQVDRLFQVDFAPGERVRARFGLPACQSVIHAHGGEIVVESQPGAGTTVRIRLPAVGHGERPAPGHPTTS